VRMATARASSTRRLRGLKNISWLSGRQLDRLSNGLTVSMAEKRAIIFDEKHSPDSAYILLAGVARITCRNRKGQRTLVIMVAPGMIPGFPPPVPGISYNFRCEAVTLCRIGTIELEALVEISLGIASVDFKRMAESYLGRWDLVQLRCANFMSCSLEERLALILLELSENFGIPDPKGIRLTLPTRHRDIAELVGASRPRITEQLISFEKKHLISRNSRTLVVNRDRLEGFLSQAHISRGGVEIGKARSSLP
jgi:CRP-like cAMP-binding protein